MPSEQQSDTPQGGGEG